jgi:hypothetical protein
MEWEVAWGEGCVCWIEGVVLILVVALCGE